MQTIIDVNQITRQARLGEFLRLKRNSVTPEAIGLAKPNRSRTPGLRREDVAERANISTVWYAKLERGKAQRVSRQVLLSVSHALCCDESETRYLLQLAGHVEQRMQPVLSYCVPDAGKRLLKSVNPLPAVFINDYKDIVLANQAFNLMLGFDVNSKPVEKRNAVIFASECPDWQRWLRIENQSDFDACMQRTAAGVRASMANRVCESEWQNRLEQLLDASQPFRSAWDQNSVKESDEMERVYHHALLGDLNLRKQYWDNRHGDTFGQMMVFVPTNDEDEQRLHNISAE